MREPFFDLFVDAEDHPSHVPERGVPPNTLFSYVPSALLDGFMFYLEPFFMMTIERYQPLTEERRRSVLTIAERSFHLNLSEIDDDVLILSRSKNRDGGPRSSSVWFVRYDPDVSDCEIGRFDSVDEKRAIELLREWLHRKGAEWTASGRDGPSVGPHGGTNCITGRYVELPIPRGCIAWR